MERYERAVRVRAPFERVWEFHSSTDGLVALTPEWMGLRVESVRGPEGEADPGSLDPGTIIRTSVRPFGIGPRKGWISEIVARDRHDGSGYFRDVMVDGPFDEWTHSHQFYADGDETIVRDRVAYRLPGATAGDLLGPLAVVGFEPMFRYRHRETRRLLE